MGVDNLSACPDKSFEQNSKFEFFCVESTSTVNRCEIWEAVILLELIQL